MYNLKAWRGPGGARLTQLQKQPLCEDCLREGIVTPATDVDHVIPHCGNLDLFLDPTNFCSKCRSHHSRKTATHDHGFGNA